MRKDSKPSRARMLSGLPSSSIQQKRAIAFQVGDQVLVLKRPLAMTHKIRSKFTPKWEGPYVVHGVYANGAYKIEDGQGV